MVKDWKNSLPLNNDDSLTVLDVIKNYLREDNIVLYENEDNPLIHEVIKKIENKENVNENEKIDLIQGEKLINWRKWLITVYNHNNEIIPFRLQDKLKRGYRISISFFSAKDLLGENYKPIIYKKKWSKFLRGKSNQVRYRLKRR